jgi:chemotaxis protein CheZ
MFAKRFRIEMSSDVQGGPTRGAISVPQAASPHPKPDPDRLESGRPIPINVAAANAAPVPNFSDVQGDLYAMKNAIALTKHEIASLQRSATGLDGMQRAAGELDAVASATESATTTILGAVEDIESASNLLRASGLEGRQGDYVGTILDRVILLYETCNFQDLTGQRIEKVVDTLKFVEQRLDSMIAAWEVAEVGPRPAIVVAKDDALISGPGLPGDEQVSQSDIDAYFK